MDAGNANQARHRPVFSTQGTKIEYLGGAGLITTSGRKRKSRMSSFDSIGDAFACIGSYASAFYITWRISKSDLLVEHIGHSYHALAICLVFLVTFLGVGSILAHKKFQNILNVLLITLGLIVACVSAASLWF